GAARLRPSARHRPPPRTRYQRDRRALAAVARRRRDHDPYRAGMDPHHPGTPEEHNMSHKIAVIGAGGKMGMRVSDNLVKTDHTVWYVENSPAGQQRTLDAGRELTDAATAVADADIVVLAVPDLALGP